MIELSVALSSFLAGAALVIVYMLRQDLEERRMAFKRADDLKADYGAFLLKMSASNNALMDDMMNVKDRLQAQEMRIGSLKK